MPIDTCMPIMELVRQRAEQDAPGPDDVLDFYGAALDLGLSDEEADQLDTLLTERVMRARGAL